VKHLWARVAVWLYPGVTLIAVVATGNHFIVDCVVGALLVLAAYGLVSWSARFRTRSDAPRCRAGPTTASRSALRGFQCNRARTRHPLFPSTKTVVDAHYRLFVVPVLA